MNKINQAYQHPAIRSLTQNSLVSSARRLLEADKKDKKGLSRSKEKVNNWQSEAWDYYDLVGELHFLVNTLAGQLSRATLYVGYQDDFNADPERVEDIEITGVLEALGDSRGRMSQLLFRLAVNLYIAGEGWLVGVPEKDPETKLRGKLDGSDLNTLDWRVLSTSEVSMKQEGLVVLNLDSDETLERPLDDVFLVRIWKEHPRKSWEADSSVRSSLPILSELVKLTMHVSAQTDSRLAGAGILVIPQSAQEGLQQNDSEDGYPDTFEDYFTGALIDAMSTAIQNRASASALVPVVATVPDDVVGKVQHLSFATPLDSEARNLREEALRRLALSMDAPPEVLLGTSSMNHWGGWLVKEETVSTHLESPLALICDAITTEYLWTVLRGMGVEEDEITKYSVQYDVDHLITRPSLSGDAKDLYKAGAISAEALRRTTGFDEADAPEQQLSRARQMALSMVADNPQLIIEPGLDFLVDSLTAIIDGKRAEDVRESVDKVVTEAVEEEPNEKEQPSDTDKSDGALPTTSEDEPELP